MGNHPFSNEFRIAPDARKVEGHVINKVFAVGNFYPYTGECYLGTYSGTTVDGYIACASPICVQPPSVTTVRIADVENLLSFFSMIRDWAYMYSRNENELASWDKHVERLGLTGKGSTGIMQINEA